MTKCNRNIIISFFIVLSSFSYDRIFSNDLIDDNHIAKAHLYNIQKLILQKKYKAADSILLAYKNVFTQSSDALVLSDYYRFKGNSLLGQENYSESFKNLSKAIDFREKNDLVHDSVLAYLYNNQGINELKLSHLNNAIRFFEKSIEIKKKFFNELSIASTYTNLGILCGNMAKYDKALYFYNKAETLYQNAKPIDSLKCAFIYNNKANLLKRNGHFEQAIAYLKRARNIIQSNKDISNYLSISDNLAGLLYMKKQYGEALNIYLSNDNLRSAKQLKINNNFDNIALCYSYLNKSDSAEYFFRNAIKNQIAVNGKNHYNTGNLYYKLADHYLRNKNYLNASKYAYKAIDVYLLNFKSNNYQILNCYSLLGDVCNQEGKLLASLEHYKQVITGFNLKQKKTNPESYLLIHVCSNSAMINEKLYEANGKVANLFTAFKLYQLAYQNFELLEQSYLTNSNRIRLFGREYYTLRAALKNAAKLYILTKEETYLEYAFLLSEKIKGAVINNSLAETGNLIKGNVPDSILNIESELKRQISFLENENEGIEDIELIASNDKLFKLYKSFDNLTQYIKENYPKYFSLKYKNEIVNFTQIQRKLKDNQVAIEYTLLPDQLIVFLISNDDVKLNVTEIQNDFYEELRYVHNFVYNNPDVNLNSSYLGRFIESSNNLYNTLLKPFENEITGRKLIIVPDAELNKIPFEVLLTKNVSENSIRNFASLPYLIWDFPVNYNYSLTSYLACTDEDEDKKLLEIAAFAPKYDNSVKSESREELGYLKNSLSEIRNISKILNTEIYSGSNATVENFKSALQQYSVLHLAMHTGLNAKNPMQSELIFNSADNTGTTRNEFKTYELFNLNARPKHVVLSACNTGSGKFQKGEGLLSIAWGFLYSGCKSIVMTLWDLNDKSAATIMPYYYKYLASGLEKDIALQNAKIEYLQSAESSLLHPYYWAAFVSLGNTSPLNLKSTNRINAYVSLVPLAILLLIFLFLKKFIT